MTDQTSNVPSTAVAKSGYLEIVEQSRASLSEFLPDTIDEDRFIRTMNATIKSDKYLMQCLNSADGRKSLLMAFRQCAMDGLFPDGKREAAIVAFKGNASYIPMYGGILKRMRNSGEVLDVETGLVCQEDFFDFERGTDGFLRHKQALTDRGEKIAAWALIRTKDGGKYFDVMGKDEILQIKAAVKAKKGPWFNAAHEGEMWRKTALRRAGKVAPLSSDVQNIFDRDNSMYDFSGTQEETVADRMRRNVTDMQNGKSLPLIPPEGGDAEPEPEAKPKAKDPEPEVIEHQRAKPSGRQRLGEPQKTPDSADGSRVSFSKDPDEMTDADWEAFATALIDDFNTRGMSFEDFDQFYVEELNHLAEASDTQYSRILGLSK